LKKLITILVMVAIFATLCVVINANELCESLGNVPKVPTSTISVDGKMEAAYKDGLVVDVNRGRDGDYRTDVYGIAYFLYDDNYIYLFCECHDDTPWNILDHVNICEICGRQKGQGTSWGTCDHYDSSEKGEANFWDDDCIEFMIDWANQGGTPSQYRISRSGICSRDFDTNYVDKNALGYLGAATTDNAAGIWYGELAIPLDTSAKGTELGVTVFMANMITLTPYNQEELYLKNSLEMGGAWEASYYDYIVLGDELSTVDTTVEVGGEPVDQTLDGQTSGGNTGATGDGSAAGGNAGGTTGGTTRPQTSDPVVSIVLVAIAVLGAAVVVKKICFNK